MNANTAKVKRSRKKKLEFIQRLKSNPCVDCGNTFHPEAMHFDHLNPDEKILNISRMTTYSILKILAEIEKCELVCANCHAVRTYNRRWRVV